MIAFLVSFFGVMPTNPIARRDPKSRACTRIGCEAPAGKPCTSPCGKATRPHRERLDG